MFKLTLGDRDILGGNTNPLVKSMQFTDSLTSICSSFQATLSFIPTDVNKQDVIRLSILPNSDNGLLSEEVVFTGILDKAEVNISPQGTTSTISGRSMTSLLVDGYVYSEKQVYKNINILDFFRTISANGYPGRFISQTAKTNVMINEAVWNRGDTIFSVIDRYCGEFGIDATTDSLGNLVFFENKREPSGIAVADNTIIKSVVKSLDYTKVFSDYIIYGARQVGTNVVYKKSQIDGIDVGDDSFRYKKRFVQVEDSSDTDPTEKAVLYRDICELNAEKIAVSLSTWVLNNRLFTKNTLLTISLPENSFDDKSFLIHGLRLSFNFSQGFSSQLDLVDEDSYEDSLNFVNQNSFISSRIRRGSSGSRGNRGRNRKSKNTIAPQNSCFPKEFRSARDKNLPYFIYSKNGLQYHTLLVREFDSGIKPGVIPSEARRIFRLKGLN